MKHTLILLSLIFLLAGCDKSHRTPAEERYTVEKKYFFDFDKVVHYQANDIDINAMFYREVKSKEDSLMMDFLFAWRENGHLDPNLNEKLRMTRYKSKVVDTLLYPDLREVFSYKIKSTGLTETITKEIKQHGLSAVIMGHAGENYTASVSAAAVCAPTFRDLYTFYKNSELIGFAKICFDCSQAEFYGTTVDNELFTKYSELKKINKNEKFIK